MRHNAVLFVLLMLATGLPAVAQQSDYEIKRDFEQSYDQIRTRIDAATTMAALDTLRASIASLQTRYSGHRTFLDKALYPETFTEKMEALRAAHNGAVNRLRLTAEQGILIAEYERTIARLTGQVDSLTRAQKRMFEEIQANKDLRETIRRLNQSIQLKDRLIFAMADSIFMPYEKEVGLPADMQKEAVSRRVLKSNIVARVYDIAADNIRFLEVAKPQGKEFGALLDHVQEFDRKWSGLRDKMNAVAVDAAQRHPPKGKGRAAKQPLDEQMPAVHVDSAVTEWRQRLMTAVWDGIAGEFTSRGVAIRAFSDGPTFAASIRAYIDSAKADGRDASLFVHQIWKERIDKEWRDALAREGVLGKTEYASLDKSVSELGKKTVDSTFLAYLAVFLLVVGTIWWFVGRKPKTDKHVQPDN